MSRNNKKILNIFLSFKKQKRDKNHNLKRITNVRKT